MGKLRGSPRGLLEGNVVAMHKHERLSPDRTFHATAQVSEKLVGRLLLDAEQNDVTLGVFARIIHGDRL